MTETISDKDAVLVALSNENQRKHTAQSYHQYIINACENYLKTNHSPDFWDCMRQQINQESQR